MTILVLSPQNLADHLVAVLSVNNFVTLIQAHALMYLMSILCLYSLYCLLVFQWQYTKGHKFLWQTLGPVVVGKVWESFMTYTRSPCLLTTGEVTHFSRFLMVFNVISDASLPEFPKLWFGLVLWNIPTTSWKGSRKVHFIESCFVHSTFLPFVSFAWIFAYFSDEVMQYGDREEVEIRGCCIHCVDVRRVSIFPHFIQDRTSSKCHPPYLWLHVLER